MRRRAWFRYRFPVIAVSMLQERAKARGESIGLLYVDVTQVFYAVLRSLVVADTKSYEAVAFLFAQLKLPSSALDELRTILAQGPCLNQSDINQATKRDIASTFSACHFTVRRSSLLGGGATREPDPGTLMPTSFSLTLSTKSWKVSQRTWIATVSAPLYPQPSLT